ncbi:MAG: hypothetical protein QM682_09645 [Paracoccus sp. (in: a-proteobacteria)]|uniref:hypothetical protein n=1 Tax=Paracoccus sp. TaxID=267 RepID=UPI0039E5C03C
MARIAPRRIHDVAPRQSWDRVVLLFAFAAGVAGGLILKFQEINPLWSASYAALVLCIYAGLTYFTTQLRLDPEAIGDNCYYLGFLFTLTSLAVTLYFVVQAGDQDRAQLIPEVISGFGVALSSTIMGVFLRVLMMQFRADLVARERETRLELDMAARDLRDEMARSLRQIKAFSTESLQHAAEREAAMQRMTQQMAESIQARLGETTAAMQSEMRETTRAQAEAAIEALRHAISEASRGAVQSMQGAEARAEADANAAHAARLRATERMTRGALAVEAACARLAEQADALSAALDHAASRLQRDGGDV